MPIFSRTYATMSDESLMRRIQCQDTCAFNELYQRYSQRLLSFFFRLLGGDEELAQDFLQDIFLKIIEKGISFDTRQSFATWIFKVAYNMCKNEYRRRDVRSKVESISSAEIDQLLDKTVTSPDIQTNQVMFHDALTEAITTLESIHRDAFLLRFQQQFSIREISSILDCAEGTVKSRLHYATRRLAAQLQDFNPNNHEDF